LLLYNFRVIGYVFAYETLSYRYTYAYVYVKSQPFRYETINFAGIGCKLEVYMLGTHRLQISKFVEITVLVAEIMTYIKWYPK